MPTVLLTGASRGIGLEFALQYAGDGWKVHACCRNPAAAQELAGIAEAASGRVQIHRLDVADFHAIDELADSLDSTAIDVLINNAGTFGRFPFALSSAEQAFGRSDYHDWADVYRVNVFAPMKMAEAFVDHVASSEQKKLVTVSSIMGSIGANSYGGYYVYRSSKTAVNSLMKCLAIDLASRGISVLPLHPGWVRTDMGGADADVDVETSVSGLREVIAGVTMSDSGRFLDYLGAEIPW
jgi:NAD(P)-dependent dehydrogenase (short-subunit alcohol dehydrogenase family)